MHSIEFSQYNLECIKYERFHHPDPRVARRMEILSLKAAGFRHRDIAKAAGVSRSTIGRLLNLFVEEGLEGVREFHEQGPTSAPAEHVVSLSEEFRLRPPSRRPGDVATEDLEDLRDNAFGILPQDGSAWVARSCSTPPEFISNIARLRRKSCFFLASRPLHPFVLAISSLYLSRLVSAWTFT